MADAVQTNAQPHADAHAHPSNLQHHFDTPAQQFDASKFGMWLFLSTEVLFFSGLFLFYTVVRRHHPDAFALGSTFLDWRLGAINTLVLIASSLTMALGVYFAQRSMQRALVFCLVLTLIGAFTFMGIKYIEYSHKIHEQIVWGKWFNPTRGHEAAEHENAAPHGEVASQQDAEAAEPASGSHEPQPAAASAAPAAAIQSQPTAASTDSAPASEPALPIEQSGIMMAGNGPSGLAAGEEVEEKGEEPELDTYALAKQRKDVHLFLGVYFCLTGLHGIHVLAGIVMIICLLIGAIKGRYNSDYYTPIDVGGLYWHLVDLVWIFLFPLLYLV